MKNFFTALLLVLILASPTAWADSDRTAVEEGECDTLSYPIYENTDVTDEVKEKINADIRMRVSEFAKRNADHFAATNFSYEIASETSEYISFGFFYYSYPDGAAHGVSYIEGIVYSKRTGDSLPLSHFAEVTVDDLVRLYDAGGVLADDGTPLTKDTLFGNKPDYVPENYFIDDDGAIYVIFQQYELAPFCFGATRIEVTSLRKCAWDA